MLGGTWTKFFFGFNRWNFGGAHVKSPTPRALKFRKNIRQRSHFIPFPIFAAWVCAVGNLGSNCDPEVLNAAFKTSEVEGPGPASHVEKTHPDMSPSVILRLHCEIWRMVPYIHSTYTSHTLLLWPLLLPWCCKHGAAWQMLQRASHSIRFHSSGITPPKTVSPLS